MGGRRRRRGGTDSEENVAGCSLQSINLNQQEMSQHIREEDNHQAHGLDLALKDIIVRTVIPFWEYLPLPHQGAFLVVVVVVIAVVVLLP